MAIRIKELVEWLATLENEFIYIDEDGLTLMSDKDEAYLEIGGKDSYREE